MPTNQLTNDYVVCCSVLSQTIQTNSGAVDCLRNCANFWHGVTF